MISMKNILIFVKFWDFFPKWKGTKYFFRNGNNPVFTVVITVHGRNMPTLPCSGFLLGQKLDYCTLAAGYHLRTRSNILILVQDSILAYFDPQLS